MARRWILLPGMVFVALAVAAGCGGEDGPGDGGAEDGGVPDAEPFDAEPFDAEPGDAEPGDAEPGDGDGGLHDGGRADGGSPDGGPECVADEDCAGGRCQEGVCRPASCVDGVRSGDESDVDCGGSCVPCPDGASCEAGADCTSAVCADGLCAAAACDDRVWNGDESDEDCGGPSCAGCGHGERCVADADCATAGCVGGACVLGPEAGFDVSPATGDAPLAVRATSTASAGDAAIVLTEYDWGEGAGYVAADHHVYVEPGIYLVRQRVRDASGFEATAETLAVAEDPAVFACLLSPTDKSPDELLVLTPDLLGVELLDQLPGGVRSECSIAPGDGVFYFEASIAPWECDREEAPPACIATPRGLLGFGVATAAAPFSSALGEGPESFGADTSGALFHDGAFVGRLDSRSTETWGFVVDYRGASPVVHLVVTSDAGEPIVAHSRTLRAITEPVFAMVQGRRRKVGVEAQLNFGNDTTHAPFALDAEAALREAGLDGVADALVLGFGGTHAGPPNARPTLRVSGDVSVPLGSAVTVTGTASDAEDGDLGERIRWEDLATVYGSRVSGTGPSFTFTPTQLGLHPVRATVFDSDGARRQAVVAVEVSGTLPRHDPVVLVDDPRVDPRVGRGVDVAADGLRVHWETGDGMGIRANQGNLDDFWYFEATRLGAPSELGVGLVIWEGDLDPYAEEDVPPSCSVNAVAGTWQNLIFRTAYDAAANDTYGFAVDYRGVNPVVYFVIGGEVVDEWRMVDAFTAVYPMLYGTPTGVPGMWDARVNFGASPFEQDPCAALRAWGVPASEVAELGLGWGEAHATSRCP